MTQLIKDFNLIVNPADISVAHRLGRKPDQGPDKRKIVVELCRRETKQDLLKACRVVKPRNFYVNETLTRTRSTVLYGLRQARKKYPNISLVVVHKTVKFMPGFGHQNPMLLKLEISEFW